MSEDLEIAPELRRYHLDWWPRMVLFGLPFAAMAAWIAIRIFARFTSEGIDVLGVVLQPQVRTKALITLAVGTLVYIPLAVFGRRTSRSAHDLLARATRVLRTASPTVETLTPCAWLQEGGNHPSLFIFREGDQRPLRVRGGWENLKRDLPIQAQVFQSAESPDLLLARLPSGKVVLCVRDPQPAERREPEFSLALAPREVPWLIRLQIRSAHGGVFFMPAAGTMCLYMGYQLIQQPAEKIDRVGLTFGLAGMSVLGVLFIGVGVAGLLKGSRCLRFLRDGCFGWARVQWLNPLPSRWRVPQAEVRLNIDAQDGQRHSQTITASPLHWPVSIPIPVLFLPDDSALGVLQLSVFFQQGFCRFDEQGRIRVRPGVLLFLALSLAMGLAFLAPLVYPELLRH